MRSAGGIGCGGRRRGRGRGLTSHWRHMRPLQSKAGERADARMEGIPTVPLVVSMARRPFVPACARCGTGGQVVHAERRKSAP